MGIKAIKIPGGVYGRAGNPDIIGCYRRITFVIEVKKPDTGTLTKLQSHELKSWSEAGAFVYLMTSVDDIQGMIDDIDRLLDTVYDNEY